MKSQLVKNKIAIILILLTAYFIRIFAINWDHGFHLHPDERMLIMVADKINFFNNFNPNFFNYGSLPIYLLKGLSQVIDFVFNKNIANYAGMLDIGRRLSVFFDLITICFIYKITKLLFKENKIALFSSLLYSISFFPIQNTHFFVVDVPLNTFITGLIYTLLLYLKSSSQKKVALIGLTFAAAMATKFTAIIFFPIILFAIILNNKHSLKRIIVHSLFFGFWFFIFYFTFMPYSFIENTRFIADIKAQLTMNSNPYIFPYTLQYVGTIPYLYYLTNIFFWGLGPIISFLSLIGFYNLGKFLILNFKFLIKSKFSNFKLQIFFFIFYLLYFLIVGRSAVKFMRYMLPLYPFFVVLAGYGLYKLFKTYKLLAYLIVISALTWTFIFLNIYSLPHTRISASDWILNNIPKGSTLAVEHWDDRLPINGSENYKFEELTLYELPDDAIKWNILNEKLKKTDYIIIASNRLYIPLQKLSDCTKFRSCYPKTSQYYQKLFNSKLPFKKVAEFSSYPKLKIAWPLKPWRSGRNLKLEINDDFADESFTVYDHPKILIFKKTF